MIPQRINLHQIDENHDAFEEFLLKRIADKVKKDLNDIYGIYENPIITRDGIKITTQPAGWFSALDTDFEEVGNG